MAYSRRAHELYRDNVYAKANISMKIILRKLPYFI